MTQGAANFARQCSLHWEPLSKRLKKPGAKKAVAKLVHRLTQNFAARSSGADKSDTTEKF